MIEQLKYGNIIQSVTDIPLVVREILSNGVTYDRLDMKSVADFAEYDEIKPIELSEHWLERLGFEYGVNGEGEDKVEYWDKRAPLHQHSFGCFTFTITKWFEGNFTFSHHQIRRDCKYLHDLQNIWYFNTGQELTIKEPINEAKNK
jgi:hypothetical protein